MFARTQRLLLRPGWIEDAPALAQAVGEVAGESNPINGHWPASMEDAQRWLRQSPQSLPSSLLILSRTAESPELVGGAGLHPFGEGMIELDLWTSLHSRGRGFATEAGQAMLCIARALGLRLVTARAFAEDGAAARVLEKLGFAPGPGAALRPVAGKRALLPIKRFFRQLEQIPNSFATPIAA